MNGMSSLIKIVIYTTPTGKKPFIEWLEDLDITTQNIIKARIRRVTLGNFGDCKSIKNGAGIRELRIDCGPGYRMYYGMKERTLVIFLLGGNKSGQEKDIAKAKSYWLEHTK